MVEAIFPPSIQTSRKVNPSSKCNGCDKKFPSRNAIFKHLKDTDGACLSKDEYKDFVRYVRKSVKPPKVILLYGYLPYNGRRKSSTVSSETPTANNVDRDYSKPTTIRDGQDAGIILMQAILQIQNEIDGIDDHGDDNNAGGDATDEGGNYHSSVYKINRSYGHLSRSAECVRQDMDTGAVTEVMAVRLYPLRGDMPLDDWIDRVQRKLDAKFEQEEERMMASDDKDCRPVPLTPIRILGRQDMPNTKFNAEMDVTYRRIEYLLPVGFLTWSMTSAEFKKKIDNLPIFAANHKHDVDHVTEEAPAPDESARSFMLEFKNVMKLLTTRVVKLDVTDEVSVMEKGFRSKKLKYEKGQRHKKNKKESKQKVGEEHGTKAITDQSLTVSKVGDDRDIQLDSTKGTSDATALGTSSPSKKVKKTNVLKRKRYHNFTEKSMAHDYLTYRRLDRIYHRATLKSPSENYETSDSTGKNTTYIVLSMSGDLFLTGQACRVIGVLMALANGAIDPEFVDCVFDENYPHLVPTPPAPLHGMVSCEVHYANQEGKTRRILSPRVSNRFSEGWNDLATLRRVKDWQNEVYKYIDRKWEKDGRDQNGRLRSEEDWTKKILLPWAEKAKRHLDEYRCWKKNREQLLNATGSNFKGASTCNNSSVENGSRPETSLIQQIKSIDPTIPEIYNTVLQHLRNLDASGEWPNTSSKRQLVMISTDSSKDKNQQPESLTIACSKVKSNSQTQSSAYSFVEGQGGASGSFSVGIMPGGIHKQPKANSMFPDLLKAAFELEANLFPEREPSSTIAINRNAQFRPHTDSGAGAGQSTSLIVGLGTYSGGELLVEGEKHDIRYKAIEFNGWKQRHWTMPFQGERFSLVWFTPKGCEGMRGIDLYSK